MNEALRAEWLEVQRSFVADGARDRQAAHRRLDAFLARQLPRELRAAALAFRASMVEDDDAHVAIRDYLAALELMNEPTYSRYTVELSLGYLNERTDRVADAISWYERALGTCLASDEVSGATALRRFVNLRGEEALTAQERNLCRRVVSHSRAVLGLGAAADLYRLSDEIAVLQRAETGPRRDSV